MEGELETKLDELDAKVNALWDELRRNDPEFRVDMPEVKKADRPEVKANVPGPKVGNKAELEPLLLKNPSCGFSSLQPSADCISRSLKANKSNK